jgi:hypothetical protein
MLSERVGSAIGADPQQHTDPIGSGSADPDDRANPKDRGGLSRDGFAAARPEPAPLYICVNVDPPAA